MGSTGPVEIPAVRKKSAELYLHDYDLDDDLSIASPPVSKPIVDVEDPVDALSANREQTRLVAAGCRGVLKVFKMDDQGLEQVADLRSARSRRLNLLYSPSNVAWSKLKDQLVATTSNNGAVVLWDMHYKAHQRSATVVHFHRSNDNLLVSGSRDAAVFLYDLREQDPVKKFGSVYYYRNLFCCSIRACIYRPLIQFPAHQGYAASIALNPRERHLIASGGGRDKFIKVIQSRLLLFSFLSLRVLHILLVNDMSVHIWDIRRPFLPFASFEDHSDSVTDMWWSIQDPERIVSCGKDGLLVLHRMEQKQSPLSYACDMALDVAPDGLVGVAGEILEFFTVFQRFCGGRSISQPYDPFRTPVRSQLSCGLPDNAMNTLQPSAFYKLAENYLAGGHPLRTLCNHNANLAMHLGQSSVAQTWRLVGALLEQTGLQKVCSFPKWSSLYVYILENPHYNDFTGLKDEAFALKPDLTKSMFMSMTKKEHIARMNWNPMQEVARLLRYHADQGDVQTCATLALVCGRRLSDVIDDFTVESNDFSEFTTCRIIGFCFEGTHFRLSHRGCTGQTLKCRCVKCYAVCGGTCSVW
ncbi:unnamed protein product [Haemonchus placei]|uniref:GATOR2 complex protein WDR24 n=1 Tax=Haemonchus placei TaxID=6290 RepID=A0A0N4WPE1_HAEPC|nr:unnamed protein product [Haemonchus placei]